jgi:eukaryotic-like serine/threonine-protein kinase
MRFQVGQRVGDYEFLAVVDATPTGVTYRVQNLLADRQEVLKVLPADMQDDQECVDRFLREAKIHARLHHPNIAAFYNATRVDGQLVMTSELVEGASLEQRLSSGSLPVAQAARYFEQALSALSYAHREGVVHRDIKPGHLIITPDDTVKITGFGLAKKPADPTLTQPGLVLGSMYYMSPEQVKGSTDVDRRSDIYSLGVVLYEAVTGKKPFDSKSHFEVFLAQVNQDPEPPSSLREGIPPGLDHIILTAMAKQPDARFQTADQFRDSLGNLQGVLGSGAVVPTPQPEEPVPEAAEPGPLDPTPQPGAFEPPPQAEAAWPPAAGPSSQANQKSAEPACSAQAPPHQGPDSAVSGEQLASAAEALAEPSAQADYSEPAPAVHPESSKATNPQWDAPRGGTDFASPAGASEAAADNESAESSSAWGSGSGWGAAEPPPPADTSAELGTGAWPAWREPSSAPAAGADDDWAESDGAEQPKEIPLLLRPTGEAGVHSHPPGPQGHTREPGASPGSWFGEQAFAGWTSKDILAVGALTFVIVAAVFFALLTFLNR